jgi:hypothetical protein
MCWQSFLGLESCPCLTDLPDAGSCRPSSACFARQRLLWVRVGARRPRWRLVSKRGPRRGVAPLQNQQSHVVATRVRLQSLSVPSLSVHAQSMSRSSALPHGITRARPATVALATAAPRLPLTLHVRGRLQRLSAGSPRSVGRNTLFRPRKSSRWSRHEKVHHLFDFISAPRVSCSKLPS